MVIMLMNSISFMRIITIASCAMFVSGLFKITEPKIVYSIGQRCQSIPLSNIYGQCYDGAAAMAGTKTGVATQIKAINSKCLYTHCYGHALNLAFADSIKSIDCLKSTFEIGHEICKLVKKSPKRSTKLDDIRKEMKNDSKGVQALCSTRWTVRGESLESILNNFDELMELWDWPLENIRDT